MAVFSYIIVASKIKEEFQEGVASLLELCLQILFAAASFTSEETDVIFLEMWTPITVKENKSQTETIPRVYGSL